MFYRQNVKIINNYKIMPYSAVLYSHVTHLTYKISAQKTFTAHIVHCRSIQQHHLVVHSHYATQIFQSRGKA
uniref:Uncharacterized protein n=1 Tax=Anguilla anguilla TaxID=7936 RepID=A0A0E9T8R4_ANGAN